MGWFEVDKGGLRQLLEGRDKSFVLRELAQNAWDEPGVTRCAIMLEPVPGKPLAILTVEDDAPEGFCDLSHAWTLYGHTRKRADAGKRGRFNLGEKQVLALCRSARITTTTGTVLFGEDGERRTGRGHTGRGSIFAAEIPMTRAEIDDAVRAARLFMPPDGIEYVVNGERVTAPAPVREIAATLATEFEDETGSYRATRRRTTIRVLRPRAGERAMIFEMGLPIIETGDRYHYDIGQRVPMSVDRDNVSPAFLRDVRAEVLNVLIADVPTAEISDAWVRDAMADERIAEDAVRGVVRKRWGDKVVVGVPGDARSREEAIVQGYRVVTGSEMSESEWDAVRAAEAIPSTTAQFPVLTVAARPLHDAEITAEMRAVAMWAKRLAYEALDMQIKVCFVDAPEANEEANYGSRTLTFNVGVLGSRWFGGPKTKILALIIHELGHEGGAEHYSAAYHECLCHIGARLAVIDAIFEDRC
jgi:hypothetical protein